MYAHAHTQSQSTRKMWAKDFLRRIWCAEKTYTYVTCIQLDDKRFTADNDDILPHLTDDQADLLRTLKEINPTEVKDNSYFFTIMFYFQRFAAIRCGEIRYPVTYFVENGVHVGSFNAETVCTEKNHDPFIMSLMCMEDMQKSFPKCKNKLRVQCFDGKWACDLRQFTTIIHHLVELITHFPMSDSEMATIIPSFAWPAGLYNGHLRSRESTRRIQLGMLLNGLIEDDLAYVRFDGLYRLSVGLPTGEYLEAQESKRQKIECMTPRKNL